VPLQDNDVLSFGSAKWILVVEKEVSTFSYYHMAKLKFTLGYLSVLGIFAILEYTDTKWSHGYGMKYRHAGLIVTKRNQGQRLS